MAFGVKSKKSSKMYYLHSKEVKLKGDRMQKIFFFSSSEEGGLNALPAGYEVFENQKTGLPMLRKIKK
jgi:hypothetical protein